MAGRTLLDYAGSKPLYALQNIRPTLPEYLATTKSEKTGKQLHARYQSKLLENTRHFYILARMYQRGLWAKVPEAWVDNLRVRRSVINASKERKNHVFWDLEDVLKVARYEPQNLKEERMRAAICFLFLSGMRITAFCSLPVDCVTIQEGRIEQKPSRGVVTKNRKSAVTFLLPIPELLQVVNAWDKNIREYGSRYWFAPFEVPPSGNGFESSVISGKIIPNNIFTGRRAIFDGDLRPFCELVGVPVLSAHKLRHGHGVYGVRNAQTVEEMKVISQNLMHANLGITDGIYGELPEENVKRVIAKFGPKASQKQEDIQTSGPDLPPEVIQLARLLMEQK